MFMASVLRDMYCSIHLLYVNVCKILYIPAAVCNGVVISSQTLEKLSFGYTQQFKKKKKKVQLVLLEKGITMRVEREFLKPERNLL